jgi:V/A-type H+-transporting ATPase subunit I
MFKFSGSIWVLSIFAVLAFAGFIYAIRGGGIMGVIEILESASGMTSYIRIMAVGLAGAIFADAVNSIVAKMAGNPPSPGGIIGGIAIGIALHGLNFVIAAFSPTIHALRLNFVEFFMRFNETGTKELIINSIVV